jgi:hypothetical protein
MSAFGVSTFPPNLVSAGEKWLEFPFKKNLCKTCAMCYNFLQQRARNRKGK